MAKSKSQKKQRKQGGAGAADNALKVFGDMNHQRAVSANNNTIAMNAQRGGGSNPPIKPDVPANLPVVPQNNVEDVDIEVGNNEIDNNKIDNNEEAPKQNTGILDSLTSVFNGNNPTSTTPGTSTPTDTSTTTDTSKTIGGSKLTKQQLQKDISKKLKHIKQHGGTTLSFSEYTSSPSPAQQSAGQDAVAKVAVTTEGVRPMTPDAAHRGGNAGQFDLQKGFMKAGSKLSKQQLQSLNQQLDKLQQQQQQQGGVGLNEIVVPLILLYASQRYGKGKTAKKDMNSIRKTMRKAVKFSK